MKVIIITGSPATGKTTVAKELAEQKGYSYLDINSFVRDNNLSDGFDSERECDIVDEKKLVKALITYIKANSSHLKGDVIDGHMSHFLPANFVDICVVTKCDLKTLKKRLEKRGYSQLKVRENLDSEIFDICLNEAIEQGHKPVVVDTTKDYDINKI